MRDFTQLCDSILNETKGFKFLETFKVTFMKRKDDENIYKPAYFNSRAEIIINPNDFMPGLQLSQQQILNGIAVWLSEESGWTISSLDEHYINTVVYDPLKVSSYIPFPVELRNSSRELVYLKNEDNECFRWCHIRYLNPQEKNAQRIIKWDKRMVDQLNYEGITFPVANNHYCKIEGQNNININVFGDENKQFYPIYVSKHNNNDVLNLLLITEGGNKHYVLIKDVNSLMYNKTKHRERKHFCMHCLQCFSTEEVLSKHKTNCMVINGEQAIRMPRKGNNILQFQNYHKQMPAPFIIFAELEAITKKIQGCQPNNTQSYTDKFQKHTGCSYGYKVVCCCDDKYTKPVQIYRDQKPIKKFMKEMLSEVQHCQKIIATKFKKPLQMTDEDEQHFQAA